MTEFATDTSEFRPPLTVGQALRHIAATGARHEQLLAEIAESLRQLTRPFRSRSSQGGALIARSGPATVLHVNAYNGGTAAEFLMLFDTDSVPDDGAIPDALWNVADGATIDYPILRACTRGVVLVGSTTHASLTASTDLQIDVTYREE